MTRTSLRFFDRYDRAGLWLLFSAPTLRMSMSALTGQRWVEEQIWKSWVMGLDWDYSKASGLSFTHADNIAHDDVRQPETL
jgi:hypothetical protein